MIEYYQILSDRVLCQVIKILTTGHFFKKLSKLRKYFEVRIEIFNNEGPTLNTAIKIKSHGPNL